MKIWLNKNKVYLLTAIIIIGVVSMVIWREELLGTLAYPILIFFCFYLIKNPLIRLLESRIKGKYKNFEFELGIPQEKIDALFKEQEGVDKENYLTIIYLLASYILYFIVPNSEENNKEIVYADELNLLDKCFNYLQYHKFDEANIKLLKSGLDEIKTNKIKKKFGQLQNK